MNCLPFLQSCSTNASKRNTSRSVGSCLQFIRCSKIEVTCHFHHNTGTSAFSVFESVIDTDLGGYLEKMASSVISSIIFVLQDQLLTSSLSLLLESALLLMAGISKRLLLLINPKSSARCGTKNCYIKFTVTGLCVKPSQLLSPS